MRSSSAPGKPSPLQSCSSRATNAGVVADQQPLGPPGQLEPEGVSARARLTPPGTGNGGRPATRMRHRQDCESAYHVRVHRRDRPAQETAPVMADQRCAGRTERPDQPGDVLGESECVVPPRGFVAAAVPPQIDCGDMETRICQRGDLMPPGPPEFGKTVQQQYEWTLTGFRDVQPGAVGGDVPMPPRTGSQHGRGVRPGRRSGHLAVLPSGRNARPPTVRPAVRRRDVTDRPAPRWSVRRSGA